MKKCAVCNKKAVGRSDGGVFYRNGKVVHINCMWELMENVTEK